MRAPDSDSPDVADRAPDDPAAALRRAEERLAAAMRVGRLGFWEWDLASDQVAFRTGYASVLSPTYGEFEGSFAAFLTFIHPEDRDVIRRALDEARASRGQVECDIRVLFPDGHVEWRRASGRFTYDAAGQAVRAHAMLRDVDAEKRAIGELAASREQLRALALRLERVREEERTRIAREIHDELGQTLTAAKLELGWLERHVAVCPTPEAPVMHEHVASAAALLDTTMRTVRRIATELRPPLLDDLGLVPAVEWLAEELRDRSGLRVTVSVPAAGVEAGREQATVVFRALQEILTNVVRHARAGAVDIRLVLEGATVCLEVHDDGVGIPPERVLAPGALGLLGMRERVAGVGGTLRIDGAPGGGTTVAVRVPLQPR